MSEAGDTAIPEVIYRGPTALVRFTAAEPPVRSGRDPFAGYFRVYRWERRIVVRGTPETGQWEEYKCFPRTAYSGAAPVAIVWCRLDQLPGRRELDELAARLGARKSLTISAEIDGPAIRQFALHP